MRYHENRHIIRALRGFAIISILLWRFYPDIFPNGYLGFDQLFLISGFSACVLLEKLQNRPWYSLVGSFYHSQLERILPFYLLMILSVQIIMHFLLTPTGIQSNTCSAKRSLLYVSNDPLPIRCFNKQSHTPNFFAHTWAIAVEVQFYIFIPLLLVACKFFQEKLLAFSVIGTLSFLHYVFVGNSEIAMCNIFARGWQFLLGMVLHFESVKRNGKFEFLTGYKKVFLITLIIIPSYSTPINSFLARIIVTSFTAFYIHCSFDNELSFNEVVLFFGNISFALYLMHWPLYAYWKMVAPESQNGHVLILATTVMLSVVAHYKFERWAWSLEYKSLMLLIAVSVFFNAIFLFNKRDEKSEIFPVHNVYLNKTFESLEDVARQNLIWRKNFTAQFDIPDNLTWIGTHRRKGISKRDGKPKMMILGSSTISNLAPLIEQECGSKVGTLTHVTFPGCEPFYPTEVLHCDKTMDMFHEAVEKMRPDFLFIGGRYLSMGNPLPDNITSLEYDHVLAVARDQLQKYMDSVTQQIIVVHAFPRPILSRMDNLTHYIKEQLTPAEIDKLVVEPLKNGYDMARQRYNSLLEDCGEKCDVIDYVTIFHNPVTNFVRYFDTSGLTYFTTDSNLSPLGLEIVRPVLKSVCRRLDIN